MVLATLVLSATLLQAQRAGGGSRSGGAGVPGNAIMTGPSSGFFPRHSDFGRRQGYGTVRLPGYFPFWDDDGYFQNESPCQQPMNATVAAGNRRGKGRASVTWAASGAAKAHRSATDERSRGHQATASDVVRADEWRTA